MGCSPSVGSFPCLSSKLGPSASLLTVKQSHGWIVRSRWETQRSGGREGRERSIIGLSPSHGQLVYNLFIFSWHPCLSASLACTIAILATRSLFRPFNHSVIDPMHLSAEFEISIVARRVVWQFYTFTLSMHVIHASKKEYVIFFRNFEISAILSWHIQRLVCLSQSQFSGLFLLALDSSSNSPSHSPARSPLHRAQIGYEIGQTCHSDGRPTAAVSEAVRVRARDLASAAAIQTRRTVYRPLRRYIPLTLLVSPLVFPLLDQQQMFPSDLCRGRG